MDIHAPKQWAILEGTPGRERGRDGRRVLETAGPEGVPRDRKVDVDQPMQVISHTKRKKSFCDEGHLTHHTQ